MNARRVVTGVNSDGKSVVVSDGEPPCSVTLELVGGPSRTDLWHLPGPPQSPSDGGDPNGYANLAPPPGGASWRLSVFPPAGTGPTDIEPGDVIAELNEKMPDWQEHFDMSRPGMHKTETIDFNVVLSGEIWLELDEGEVHLKTGDCIVKRGGMHAWRNRSDAPCIITGVMIDARGSN